MADWEAGRRFPVASEFLRACRLARIDLDTAFLRFRPEEAPALGEADDEGVAAWLDALRGSTAINELSERLDVSRYAVSRWLKGATRPRLPDFLRLVEVLTDRLSDLVVELVDIDAVPALQDVHRERHASRTLAFEEPWTEAILRALETRAYRHLPAHLPGWIAGRLGIELDTELRCLERLDAAGVIARDEDGRWQPVGALTVDTRADPEGTLRLKHHWASLGVQRASAPREGDLVSYNVVGVSRDDLERIREAHIRYFHEVRQIVAQSEPVEVAALVNIQLMTWVQ